MASWIHGVDPAFAERVASRRVLGIAASSDLRYVEAPSLDPDGRTLRARLGKLVEVAQTVQTVQRVESFVVSLALTEDERSVVGRCSQCSAAFGPCAHVATLILDVSRSGELRAALAEGRDCRGPASDALRARAAYHLEANFDRALGTWLPLDAPTEDVDIALAPSEPGQGGFGRPYGERADADARTLAITVRRSGERRLLAAREILTLAARPRDRRVVEHVRDLGQGRKAAYATGVDASLALEAARVHGAVFVDGFKRLLDFRDEPVRPVVLHEPDHKAPGGVHCDALVAYWVTPDESRRFTFDGSVFFAGPFPFVWAADGAIHPVRRDVDLELVKRFARAPLLRVPPGRMKEAGARLIRAARGRGVTLPVHEAFGLPRLETPRFVLRLSGEPLDVHGELLAIYPARQVPLAPGRAPAAEEDSERDLDYEARALARVAHAGLVEPEPEDAIENDDRESALAVAGESAVAFWHKGIVGLRAVGDPPIDVELSERLARVRIGAPLKGRVHVALEGDWLSTRLEFGSDELPVEMGAIRAALQSKQRWIALGDGTLAQITSSAEGLFESAETVMEGRSSAKLPIHQLGRLDRWLEENDGTIDEAIGGLRTRLRALAVAAEPAMPRALQGTLRPYQRLGLSWLEFLQALGAGGILADDMGLGKTITTLAFLLRRKEAEGPAPSLVVCPTSVATNWVREAERFTPTLKVLLYTGVRRDALAIARCDIAVTTYAILRRDIGSLSEIDFRCAVLDEAQNIKNPESETARAARRLRASMRLALSGTPVENRLRELWSLASYANPGILGPQRAFETRFEKPIATDRQSPLAPELRAIVRPFLLRRTKNDVLSDLPAKTEIDRIVTLRTDGKRRYDALAHTLREGVRRAIEKRDGKPSSLSVFTALTRLRQMACDPRLVDPGLPPESSGKREAFLDLVRELVAEGRRALVFSQFVELLTLWRKDLDAEDIPYEYLDGRSTKRDAIVARFQEGNAPLFLISLKAGGAGLNLTAADTIIHCDPWWNPAVEDQATDRAHRIGQNKPVTVVRLVAAGTIEEKILSLKAKKRELTKAVIGDDAGALAGLTEEDLRILLGEDEAPDGDDADGDDDTGDARDARDPKSGGTTTDTVIGPRPSDALATATRVLSQEFASMATDARRWLATTGRLEADLATLVDIPVPYASRLVRGEPFPCSRAVAERIRARLGAF
jgi:superfamily II DNA or RNA helicase